MFQRFQLWLYTGSILETPEQDRPPSAVLLNLYIFGETRIIPELQNVAIDSTIDRPMQKSSIPAVLINHLYANTSKGSPMRQLYVDMMVDGDIDVRDPIWGIEGEITRNLYPKEFLADMIFSMQDRLLGKRQKRIDFTKERQRYYVPTSNGKADTKGGKSG